MKNDKIKTFIFQKDWHLLIERYSPKEICEVLNFSEAMHLANNLFYDNMQDDLIQQFALNLSFEIKSQFVDQWEEDWKNDVLLGHLCSILWRYEEQYIFYKKAYDKLIDPPDSLLLLLADCNSTPGLHLIDDQTAQEYLIRAIEKKMTYQAALKMRALYRHREDQKMEDQWNEIYQDLKFRNISTQTIIPDILHDSKIL